MKKSNNKAASETFTIGNIMVLFLAVITGLIHLTQPDTLLKLNGLGYLVLAAGAVFTIKGAEELKVVAPKMLIVYAITTVGMYFVLHGSSAIGDTIGLVTKVVELWLVVVLFSGQRAQKQALKAAWAPQSRHRSMRSGTTW
ncbi:MAG: hypothetical protein AB8G95_30395 [Anaerolineae bacterium]